MGLLAKIRGNATGVAAAAAARLAEKAVAEASPAAPPPVSRHKVCGNATRLVAPSDLWWLDLVVHPGDAMYGPLDEPEAAPAPCPLPGGLELADPPPNRPAVPCDDCGCPLAWEDLAGRVHCCECVPVPSRSVGRRLLRLVTLPFDGPAWSKWRPKYWDPYGHLPSQRPAEREEKF